MREVLPDGKVTYRRDHNNFHYYAIDFSTEVMPEEIAELLRLEHIGPIADLGYHLFRVPKAASSLIITNTEEKDDLVMKHYHNLLKEPHRLARREVQVLQAVTSLEPQIPRRRLFKRSAAVIPVTAEDLVASTLGIKDPGYPKQWHLHNKDEPGNDLNVTNVWLQGITGKNVTVGIIDDGLDYDNDDLKDNFSLEGSYDFNNHTKYPYPWHYDDIHGTRCAGEIAAIKNDRCGIGVAFNAKVAGIRILSGDLTDTDEALAIYYANQINQIYSCSWGPPDDGRAMDAPNEIVKKAFKKSIDEGRGGKGSLFVFATGNGGGLDDNCNFDGYTNSPYTITIGAVDWLNNHPYYSEKCCANFAVTYSSGSGHALYTTDVHQSCTDHFSGTSAAAPLVSGVYALILSIRPEITWRDAQHILVQTAVPFKTNEEGWKKTATDRWYSHTFGYGKVDAYAMVELAKTFELVGPGTVRDLPVMEVNKAIPEEGDGLTSKIIVTAEDLHEASLVKLEHVTVTVNIEHQSRGDVEVTLISPHKIESILSPGRKFDNSRTGFRDWRFMSVVHWGEDPVGEWTLIVKDKTKNRRTGTWKDWKLSLWGEQPKSSSSSPTTTTTLATSSSTSSTLASSTSISSTSTSSISASTTTVAVTLPASTTTVTVTKPTTSAVQTSVLVSTTTVTAPALTVSKLSGGPPTPNNSSLIDQYGDYKGKGAILLLPIIVLVLLCLSLCWWVRRRRDPQNRQYEFVPLQERKPPKPEDTSKELMAAFVGRGGGGDGGDVDDDSSTPKDSLDEAAAFLFDPPSSTPQPSTAAAITH